MSEQEVQENQHAEKGNQDSTDLQAGLYCPEGSSLYRLYFRELGQQFTAFSMLDDLKRGDLVMVKQEHGLEPAVIVGNAPQCGCKSEHHRALYEVSRKCEREEYERYASLILFEKRAFNFCNQLVEKHELKMSLVRVERFFNGSKMIFYFTAENRVDFRALVKDLVQEYRTRVEMRQVGVRHETKMIGGVGTCGRELCCSSFIRKFDSVSIKMAKEQDLPLNPTKISGLCNRLLCCLSYEYDTYRSLRKKMIRPGKVITVDGVQYKVRRQKLIQNSLVVTNKEGEEVTLQAEQWKKALRSDGRKRDHCKEKGKECPVEGDNSSSRDRKKESDNKQ